MFENYPHLKKYATVAGILAAIAAIVGFAVYSNDAMLFSPHGYIIVSSVPESLRLTYGDKTITIRANDGAKIPVATGVYMFTFTANGFDSYSSTITVEQDKSYDMVFSLTPRTDAAKKEAALDKYKTVYERVVGYSLGKESAQYAERYPILKILPISTLQYTIESCEPYATTSGAISRIGVCITVTDTQDTSQIDAAIAELRKNSYNPDDFIISINGHRYPSSQERANNFCTLTSSGICVDAG